ncbi:MAG: heavy metal-responsive transcriptional regulator [Chloroflexi bacterium 54-19]|nr:MAG: heavy metal-responsive transcriptional regulator [Chloroflexi bacterium 54-19]
MPELAQGKQFRIGELAAQFDLNPKTIRFYEEIGLLPVPPRTEAGYRLYNLADLERLSFITKAKAVGFSLEEIAEILKLRQIGQRPCYHMLEILDRKIAAVDQQITALQEFRKDLGSLREEAGELSGVGGLVCGIIEHHKVTGLPPEKLLRRVAKKSK